MNPQLTASPSHYDDNEVVNPSVNPHMSELLAARLSRRQALRGGMGVTTGVLLGSLGLSACGGGSDSPAPTAPTATARSLALGFTAVAKNLNDIVTVPAGYNVSIVHALGDPQHFGDASWAGDGSESADSYNRRIGDGHDGMHYFGLSEAGKFDATRSDRGLLCVNHEYVVAPHGLHPNGITANNTLGFAGVPLGTVRVASEVDKEIAAHGVSITEIKRGTSGTAMSLSHGSRFNRRSPHQWDSVGPADEYARFNSSMKVCPGLADFIGNSGSIWRDTPDHDRTTRSAASLRPMKVKGPPVVAL